MLQYLVVLAGTDPLVWRRIRVPATYSFWDLHVAIQDAMGWLDCHLHEFRVTDPSTGKRRSFGIPDPDGMDLGRVSAGWLECPLDYTTGDGALMQYTYDFGDSWEHAVFFEEFARMPGRRKVRPECIGGGGACPLEDSGGPGGYSHLLEVLADPAHPEHREMVEWAGPRIDPARFSVKQVRFDDPAERWRMAFEPEDV